MKRQPEKQQGVALLAVLWMTVTLSLMAMSTAYLVRTEVAAVSNQIESQRSYFLARGGIEAAVFSIVRSSAAVPAFPGLSGVPPEFTMGQRWLRYEFPGGGCSVEVVPETAKLNINQASREQLAALFVSVGLPAGQSAELAEAIVDWRTPRASELDSRWDSFYAALPSPVRARHAPLDHLEEALPVRGMSRDFFFSRIEPSAEGRWQRWPAFGDLLTTQSPGFGINPNYAAYEILRSLPGWNDAMAAAVIAARTAAPFRSMVELDAAAPEASALAGLAPLTLAQGPVYTLTATGTLPGSPVRRSVRALVQVGLNLPLYHRVLAWWDDWPWPHEPPQAPEENSKNRS